MLACVVVLRLWAKAHSAAAPFFSFIQRLSQQTKLAALTQQEELPWGVMQEKSPLPNLNLECSLTSAVRPASAACSPQWCIHTTPEHTLTNTHTHGQTHHSLVQTVRSWGLCCSISPLLFILWFFLYFGRSWLGLLLLAITLLLALSYLHLLTVILAPLYFILPLPLFISLSLCLVCQALNV